MKHEPYPETVRATGDDPNRDSGGRVGATVEHSALGDTLLVTISYTGSNATDLGYLLHKHPARLQTIETSVGRAHVFYPEADSGRCTAAMLLEVDSIALAKNRHLRGGAGAASLDDYVNDRPYASSSMTAVALGQLFRTAMTGRCDARPELAASAMELTIKLTAVPVKGGADMAAQLFAPLGWRVVAETIPLDPQFPDWGDSHYFNIELAGRLRLQDALRQIYALLPVMDDSKHYWVGDDEVGKLLRAGEGWLAGHPARGVIMKRYLAHQRGMVDAATELLAREEEASSGCAAATVAPAATIAVGPVPVPLHRLRGEAVLAALLDVHAQRVVDLGCGEGALLQRLASEPRFTEIIGADVSAKALARAADRLHMDELGDRQRERLRLIHTSATYLDARMAGMDAVVLMEVIEHLEPARLPTLLGNVFGHARPGAVIVTTPNADYNPLYPQLPTGAMRHPDHRFEWTRAQLKDWAQAVCQDHGYAVEFRAVGQNHPDLGSPTQLALFRRI